MSPVATKNEVYNALCDVAQSSFNDNDESIEASNCPITLTEEGLSVPNKFIPKVTILHWYSVRQKDNLCFRCGWLYLYRRICRLCRCCASARTLFVRSLLGGVYGGGRWGSQVGKEKFYYSHVISQNSKGSTVAQGFRLVSMES